MWSGVGRRENGGEARRGRRRDWFGIFRIMMEAILI